MFNCFVILEQEANIKYIENYCSKRRLHIRARRARSTKTTRQIGISMVASKKSQIAPYYMLMMMAIKRLKTVIYETVSSLFPILLSHHRRCHPTRLAYATEWRNVCWIKHLLEQISLSDECTNAKPKSQFPVVSIGINAARAVVPHE